MSFSCGFGSGIGSGTGSGFGSGFGSTTTGSGFSVTGEFADSDKTIFASRVIDGDSSAAYQSIKIGTCVTSNADVGSNVAVITHPIVVSIVPWFSHVDFMSKPFTSLCLRTARIFTGLFAEILMASVLF